MQVDYFNVLSFVLMKSKENTFRKSNCTFLHEHSYFTSTKLQSNHKQSKYWKYTRKLYNVPQKYNKKK